MLSIILFAFAMLFGAVGMGNAMCSVRHEIPGREMSPKEASYFGWAFVFWIMSLIAAALAGFQAR